MLADRLGLSLKRLKHLKAVIFNLRFTGLYSVDELVHGLVDVPLNELSLNLTGCRGLQVPLRKKHSSARALQQRNEEAKYLALVAEVMAKNEKVVAESLARFSGFEVNSEDGQVDANIGPPVASFSGKANSQAEQQEDADASLVAEALARLSGLEINSEDHGQEEAKNAPLVEGLGVKSERYKQAEVRHARVREALFRFQGLMKPKTEGNMPEEVKPAPLVLKALGRFQGFLKAKPEGQASSAINLPPSDDDSDVKDNDSDSD